MGAVGPGHKITVFIDEIDIHRMSISGLLKNYFSNEKVLNIVLTIDINVVFDDKLFWIWYNEINQNKL